jgi:hypothetical protein
VSGASWFDELSVSTSTRSGADGGTVAFNSSGWTVATGQARADATNTTGAPARGAAGFDFGPVALGLLALAGLALALRARG